MAREPLDANSMPVDGLQFSTLHFVGDVGDGWQGAAIDRAQTRLIGAGTPGCDMSAFVRFDAPHYNLRESRPQPQSVEADPAAPVLQTR